MIAHVAVLTVTYNQERYIARAIDSVISQQRPDWEMVIVDDGSSDRTCDIALSYRDPRVRVIRLPHRGIMALKESYAVALAETTAPLLAILDGDDYWFHNRLQLQVRRFQDSKVVISFGAVHLVDRDGRLIERVRLPRFAEGIGDGSRLALRILSNQFFPHSVTVLVRRDAVIRHGGFVQPDGAPFVDVPTWLHLLPGQRFAGIGVPLACYRVHDSSVCRTMTSIGDEAQMRFAEEFLQSQWRTLGLDAEHHESLQRTLTSFHAHRRAVAAARRNWREAQTWFSEAFRHGTPLRKLKTAARWALLACRYARPAR